MRTSIDIPDSLLRSLERRAVRDGVSVNDLVVALLDRELAALDTLPVRRTADLPSVRLGSPMALPARAFTNARLSDFL